MNRIKTRWAYNGAIELARSMYGPGDSDHMVATAERLADKVALLGLDPKSDEAVLIYVAYAAVYYELKSVHGASWVEKRLASPG